jgi:hypothetical protein
VGALAAIAAVCLLVATGMMEIEEGGYWELLYATNLTEGDTFGQSNPKYVGVDSYWELDCFAQRKRVVFRKEWYRKTGKEVMEGRPLLHRLLGFKSRCKGCLKLIIMMLF